MSVTVPNVVGDLAAAAATAITAVGLVVGTKSGIGVVSTQSPVAGSVVSAGTAVNLTFAPYCRVQAAVAGYYLGDYKDIGDVFDVLYPADFASSTVSLVPVGNADYPIYGWMTQVPSTTPLFSWALVNGGASSPRNSPRRTVV